MPPAGGGTIGPALPTGWRCYRDHRVENEAGPHQKKGQTAHNGEMEQG